MNIKEKYNAWLAFADEKTKQELISVSGDEKELEDRFYKDLAFGTGGLRGIMGAGSNRMNVYTVGRATLGLANYLMDHFPAGASVAIAYDTRNNSSAFSLAAARILAANGIRVYRYKYCVPVPVLSFTTRRFGCSAGIMITASHNPKEYNGYKVYDETGCQICTEAAAALFSYIEKEEYSDVSKLLSGAPDDRITEIGDEILADYYKAVGSQSLYTEPSDLKIVYTPLHGTGNVPVRHMLGGFDVHVVKEQELPDGNFSTVRSPNPEEKDALNIAIEYAKEKALDAVVEAKEEFILADERGILEYQDYNGMMEDMEKENKERAEKEESGEAYYGLTEYTPFTYYQYMSGNVRSELEKNQEEITDPTEEELRQVYEENKESLTLGMVYNYTVRYADGTEETVSQNTRDIGKEDTTTEDLIDNYFSYMQPGETVTGYSYHGETADITLQSVEDMGYMSFEDAEYSLRAFYARTEISDLIAERVENAEIVFDQERWDALEMP